MTETTPLVQVRGLVKEFEVKGHRGTGLVKAVTEVDLDILPGEAVGLVGESGSGKTTLARNILRLIEPTAGSIRLEGTDITHLGGNRLRRMRPQIQVVFQDPVGSLDPRMSVFDLIAEPMRAHRKLSRNELRTTVERLIDEVGLERALRDRRPHELSGGQCQRVAIARALAMNPKIMLFDEVTSALDPELVEEVLTVLRRLAADSDTTMLTVTHEMNFARDFADRVLFFDKGKIVESGKPEDIFTDPREPRTREFLSKFITVP